MPRRPKIWIVLLALVLPLMACSLPANVAQWTAPSPTPVVVPTVTPAPPPTAIHSASAPSLLSLEEGIINVYQTLGQSVVNITNRSYAYDFFFRPVPQEGTGSGFVYDTQGHIVTNYHVIEGAEELYVTLADETTAPAQVVGSDPSNDLAVIKVDVAPELLRPTPLGDSEQVRVGQFVIAIGNPFGLEQTPDERFIGEIIQTDAAINPGNSGGPLLNVSGQVVGVNTAIFSPSRASAGIGFAVPVNTVRRVVPELLTRGYYPHPWLGVNLWPLTPERADILRRAGMDVPVDEGILIVETTPGGPAEEAGLRGGQEQVRLGRVLLLIGGDILTAIDGEPITSDRDLVLYLDTETQIGQTIQVTIWRDGDEMTVPVTLTERPR
jgi:S1-C subfamily serine protease